jgi:hypothetical protein
MAHSHDNHDEHSCCEHTKNVAVVQTIDEMDFERGIWSAGEQIKFIFFRHKYLLIQIHFLR